MASLDTIKNTLQAMKFAPVEGKNSEWAKTYSAFNHSITVTLAKAAADCRINYGPAIKNNAGRSTTQNLSQSESLVVLECIDRLLDLGYPPASLILEKQYPLGHTGGYLDVVVLQDGVAYLMIECKTWGAEFDKERAKLFDDGGQMLTYFHQDRKAKFIALYASRLSAGAIERNVCAVDTSFLDGDSVAELFESWDKSHFEVGAFDGTPYQIQERRLTKADLEHMKQEDGGRIFNAFAEILRRHTISDKPNAFNKIFNLFICKVQDEEKQDDEVLDFQWQAGETAKSVLSRLNDLYKEGMSQYLRMEIADHTEAEIDKLLGGSGAESDRQALHNIFTELRLYKNNEFAFKEVFDEKTFHANAEVVREIVRLLQGKKLRYASKQQFLGDFFELLLNTSVKQEAGQFFTPIPIARFVIDSLPLKAMIDAKLKANDANFLPYFLDFASGSGHFMTEGMDRIDRMVKKIDGSKMRTALKGNLRKWCEDYAWANEFVYGIEKDYRLAKTAKVSCFLNGDGEANMILGDGLDHFALSQEYTGKLKAELSEGERDNQQFDVIAANPPYSVGACKKTIRHGEKSFSLWPRLTDASSEIECLFMERAKQLLKPGGVTGILLPSSMLSNGGIYEATRDMLLRYFRIKAIAAMGTGTFMATGTNTVILFMERRDNNDHTRIASLIAKFLEHWQDITVAGQENAFTHYAMYIWNISLVDYVALLRGDSTASDHALLGSYLQAFDDLTEIRNLKERKQFKGLAPAEQAAQLETRFRVWLREREQEKMLTFFLANGQNVVLAKAPSDKNSEKAFLGYEFSNRKGSEGLKILSGTGRIETALYSETDDADPDKINTLIRQNFLGEEINVPQALADYVTISPLLELMTFDQVRFDKAIGTSIKKKAHSKRWPMVKLGGVADISSGGTPSTKKPEYWSGDVHWATIEDVKQKYLYATRRKISTAGSVQAGPILPINTVLFSSRATIGEISITKIETTTNQGFKNFICRPDRLDYEYLYYVLKREAPEMTASCGGMTYLEISASRISDWPIPLPPLPEQQRIACHLSRYDLVESRRMARIQEAAKSLYATLSAIAVRRPVGDFCALSGERIDPADTPEKDFNYIGLEHIAEGTGEIAWSGAVKGATIKSTKSVFHKGDVLYGKLRPYLNKVWIAEFDGVCTTEMLVLKPRIPETATLLKYMLLHPDFVEQAKTKTGGISLPRIKPADVLRIAVADIEPEAARLSKLSESVENTKLNDRNKLDRLRTAKRTYLENWLG
jgi:type I restriction enzyme M protein